MILVTWRDTHDPVNLWKFTEFILTWLLAVIRLNKGFYHIVEQHTGPAFHVCLISSSNCPLNPQNLHKLSIWFVFNVGSKFV